MPLKIYQRPNGVFHIRGKVQGIAYDRSAKTSSRSEAEALKAKIEADLFKRAVYGDKAVATFDEAVAVYLRAGGSPDYIDPILDKIGHMKLSDVNKALVDKIAHELKPNVQPQTRIRQIYTPIIAVMTSAAENGLCDPVKIKKPKFTQGRTEYLTPQEAEDWLAALPEHLKRIVTFYLGTGCRASEAINLIWKDVTLGERRVTLWDDQTKEDYARSFDLQTRVKALMPARPEGVKAALLPVFLNSKGEPWHGYDAINLMLRRKREQREREIAKGSKLPHLVPLHCHLLRHTWATWAYACTRDLTYLMQQGGWRSVDMVMRYTHAGSPDLARAILKAGWEFSGRELPLPPKNANKSKRSQNGA